MEQEILLLLNKSEALHCRAGLSRGRYLEARFILSTGYDPLLFRYTIHTLGDPLYTNVSARIRAQKGNYSFAPAL